MCYLDSGRVTRVSTAGPDHWTCATYDNVLSSMITEEQKLAIVQYYKDKWTLSVDVNSISVECYVVVICFLYPGGGTHHQVARVS